MYDVKEAEYEEKEMDHFDVYRCTLYNVHIVHMMYWQTRVRRGGGGKHCRPFSKYTMQILGP